MILSQKYLGVVLCLITSMAFGQTNDEIRKKADDFFESEKYVEATKDYLHLLSIFPTDPDLNFKYGTCLLYNSRDKNKALRYLNFAIKNEGIDPRAFFFNGKALHLDYQFEKAKQSYIQYQEKRVKKDDRYKVELAIKMCDNGKKLLANFTDIIVTNKQEISSDNFYKIYSDSKTIGGEILVVEKFQSKLDKKFNHVPVVHFPPNCKAIYYSSYGEEGATGLDIYIRRKLPDGTWGDPQLLPGEVNSMEDENFPYLHPSGNFLFFSSKGHNSMGGYDVFMSRFDTESNSFFTPENVDFAISSPDDDLFYVVDSLFQNAYFASSRQSEAGKFHVYNVKVARIPVQEVIVMGNFISEINPDNETMRVTVTSTSNGNEVGKIVSNEKGKYSFVFPKGGKYNLEISVESNENSIYKYVVELPFLDEFRPLKQKAIHKMADGQEIVTIINLFDEEVEGAEAMIAEVIRKKSALDVNIDKFDLKELEKEEERRKILAELGFHNMSIPEISGQLNDLANNEKKRSDVIERIESNLDLAIIANSTELAKLEAELKEILAKIEKTTDPIEKHALLMEAKKVESELNQLTAEMNVIETMKNELLQKFGAPMTSGVGKIEVIENQFNALVSSGKDDDAYLLLIKNKSVIQQAKNESPEKYISDLVERSVKLNEDIKVLKKQQVDFELNESSLTSQINQLKSQLLNAKKKDAEQIQSQINEKESELVMVRELLVSTKRRIIEKNTELNVLNNSIETLQKAIKNTDLAAYNKSEVEVVLKKAKAVENEVKSVGIDKQINEIERENPELKSNFVTSDSGENSLATIQNDYNEKINEIQSNKNLSAEEKLNQEQKANNESVANVNSRINAIERELSVTPGNETLIAEQNSLNEYKNELEKENQRLNKELLALNNSNVNQSNQLDLIKTNLDNRIAEIQSDATTSLEEKIKLQQQANNESIAQINQRIETIQKELKVNPNNTSLKTEQSSLNQLKTRIENQNKALDNELLAINSTSAENDLVAIQNALNEKLSALQSDNSKSAEEKIKEQQQANNVALTEINERIAQIDKALKNDPNNLTLKNEKSALNEYKNEIQSDNQKLSTELLALKNSSVNQENQLVSIQSDLKDKVNAIQSDNSKTEAEKIKATQQANNETIAQVEKRIKEIDKLLTSDPNNANLKSEKTQLENYKAELQSDNLRLNGDLIALNNGNTPEINQLASIQSDLKNKVSAIQSDNSKTQAEKIKATQQVNNETIAKIDKRINEIENQLSSDPDNTTLLEEQLALIQYKSILEQENTRLSENLAALNKSENNTNISTITKEGVLTSVQADYQDKVNAIQSNNAISEVEKLNQLQALDQKLIVSLQKENTANDKALNKQPSDENLKTKKEILNSLIEQKQNEVEERAQVINAKNNVSSVVDVESVKADLLTSVNPTYTDKKAEIVNSNSTAFEKNSALLTLEVDQLNKLKIKQTEIERLLKKNPSDEKLKAEQQAIKTLISEQEQVIETLKTDALKSISADVIAEKVNRVDPNYTNDIQSIQSENNSTKTNDLIAREKELQEKLNSTITTNEKALNRSYSVTVDLENMILKKALEESQARIEKASNNDSQDVEKNKFIAEVRATNDAIIESTLQSNPKTKTELEKADETLAQYESELKERLARVESEIASSPSDELKTQKAWLTEELAEVQKKRREFSISIGELETDVVSNNTDSKVEQLKTELVERQKETDENSEALSKAIQESPSNETLKLALKYNTEKQAEIESILTAAENETSSQEKERLLNEASEAQNELNNTLKEVLAENKIKVLENESGVSMRSEEELNDLKRKFSIEIGELTMEIEKADQELKVATGNDKVQVQQKKENLIQEKSLLELRMEELMRNRPKQEKEVEPVIADNIKNQTITSSEKSAITSNTNYENYYNSASKAIELEKELIENKKNLNNEKSELVKMIESGNSLSEANVKETQAKINALETSIKSSEKQFNEAKQKANNYLPSNNEEASKMKALVAQGVAPDKSNTVVAENKNNIGNSDFKIYPKNEVVEKSMIPVVSENKSGLIYRVQVGAYSKPIPSTLFSEFDPVTGEVINGTQIVRYMAGYFSNSNAAYSAQSKIRGFGYRDAFVVAYCNGERISIGEAKRRQSRGTCVGTGETIFNADGSVQILSNSESSQGTTFENREKSTEGQRVNNNSTVSNNVPQNGNSTGTNATKQSNSNEQYLPVESMDGLFYTVQIGVYKGFVSEKHLHGMSDVVSLKLPDGQVRYSSGVFSSLDEAKPRRTQALNNGVRGAFITAYYQGKRITISEAKQILSANGSSVLQSEIEKNKKKEELIVVEEAKEEIDPVELKKKNRVQFVSLNEYDSFPSEVITRYNKRGMFYYDSKDLHIKSIVYQSEDDLPKEIDFKNQLEVVQIESESTEDKVIMIKIKSKELPGDFMNWLMKIPYSREFIEFDDRIEINLFGIEPNDIEKVQEDIRTFVLEMEVRSVSEVEFENLK